MLDQQPAAGRALDQDRDVALTRPRFCPLALLDDPAAAGPFGLARQRAREALPAVADPEEQIHGFAALLVAQEDALPERHAAEEQPVGFERRDRPPAERPREAIREAERDRIVRDPGATPIERPASDDRKASVAMAAARAGALAGAAGRLGRADRAREQTVERVEQDQAAEQDRDALCGGPRRAPSADSRSARSRAPRSGEGVKGAAAPAAPRAGRGAGTDRPSAPRACERDHRPQPLHPPPPRR
jgi:hypothetical protein